MTSSAISKALRIGRLWSASEISIINMFRRPYGATLPRASKARYFDRKRIGAKLVDANLVVYVWGDAALTCPLVHVMHHIVTEKLSAEHVGTLGYTASGMPKHLHWVDPRKARFVKYRG
jgi:hypothetical protein